MRNFKTILYKESRSVPDPWVGTYVKTGNQVQGYTEVFKLWKNDLGVVPYEGKRIYMHSN